MTTGPLTELLARRPALVLDGAMGTELQRRGVETGLPLWSARALMTQPETVLQIHREYCDAGADILTTEHLPDDAPDVPPGGAAATVQRNR